MAEFARGRVCRGRLCQGPRLSGAEFVRGRDVQYPTKLPLEVVSIVSKTGFGFSKINEKTSFGF